MRNGLPFGGKLFILGGVFRQVTPVIPKANKAVLIENSIKHKIEEEFKILQLKKNMRADEEEIDFAKYILNVGNGEEKFYEEFGEDMIRIPEECIVKGDIVADLFGSISNPEELKHTCCLSTKNEFVDEINERIQNEIVDGDIHTRIR